MELAPRTVQNISDRLSLPITVTATIKWPFGQYMLPQRRMSLYP
jgi:hypothetical protein